MKILYVCHRFPYPPKRGGKIRPFNMIRHLAKTHEVTVCSLSRSDSETAEAQGIALFCSYFQVAQVNDRIQQLAMVAALPTPVTASTAYFHSATLSRKIRQLMAERAFDLVFVHCSSVAHYVQHVTAVPKILDFGDMDSQKWLEYAQYKPFPLSVGYWWEGTRLHAMERRLARKFDLCTATTRAERETLDALGTSTPSDWFPNGVDSEYFAPSDHPYDPDTIVFVGRMDYFPNQQCMFEFCANVLPRIRAKRPQVKLQIVGADPSPAVRALGALEGVTVTGSVPDVRPYVTRAALTIAPLRIARGTQNKILEAMAMGVPVVCSAVAAGGVDAVAGEHLLVADSTDQLCGAITGILDDPSQRMRLATAGRARVLSNHAWASSMRKLDSVIERCIGSFAARCSRLTATACVVNASRSLGITGAPEVRLAELPVRQAPVQGRRVRVLTITSLYPSTARPRHGIFVETRLRHLLHDCPVEARVLAPVPWFPFRARWFGSYAAFAATPRRDTRAGGLSVSYPRYPMLPKVGVAFQPDAMARACVEDIRALQRSGWQPDLIDAHYLYPDGVAAAKLSRSLGLPLVLTARGTDVNVLARQVAAGRRVLWAASEAAAVIAVSTRLKEALVELGVDGDKISVVRNGVDTEVFKPMERSAARISLGLKQRTTLACVGNLVPEKGHALAIDGVAKLPDAQLVIVGEGPLRSDLEHRARDLGAGDRVVFMPSMPQADLARVYSAADVLLLCSTREGWPNVVLEALACGTPVAATDVGAVNEILTDRHVGRVIASREVTGMLAAVTELLSAPCDRLRLNGHAARYDWHSVSRAQMTLFRDILDRSTARSNDTGLSAEGLA